MLSVALLAATTFHPLVASCPLSCAPRCFVSRLALPNSGDEIAGEEVQRLSNAVKPVVLEVRRRHVVRTPCARPADRVSE